jgi:hypothetical protein
MGILKKFIKEPVTPKPSNGIVLKMGMFPETEIDPHENGIGFNVKFGINGLTYQGMLALIDQTDANGMITIQVLPKEVTLAKSNYNG